MSHYARGTGVSSDRTRSELERVLARYGADRFGYVTGPASAEIAFVVRGRAVRMRLALPDPEPFKKTARGRPRPPEAARREWEGACRQSWRCLLLVVKAKLEAIESGIATFDDEWLAYLVLKGGRTVGEALAPQLEDARATGAPLLLGMDPPKEPR